MCFVTWWIGCFFSIPYRKELFTAEYAENAEAKKFQNPGTNAAKRGPKRLPMFKNPMFQTQKFGTWKLGNVLVPGLGIVIPGLGFNHLFWLGVFRALGGESFERGGL
jgi:hypothetical protein